MKHTYSGRCRCGTVVFSVDLPQALEALSARTCDCDFCVARKASYLSHPAGSLHITSQQPFAVIKQGSEQAAFLTCASCATLVAVVYPFKDGLKGAVNAALLTESARLPEPVVVSPKRLEPEEKLRRWEAVWLRVRVNPDVSQRR